MAQIKVYGYAGDEQLAGIKLFLRRFDIPFDFIPMSVEVIAQLRKDGKIKQGQQVAPPLVEVEGRLYQNVEGGDLGLFLHHHFVTYKVKYKSKTREKAELLRRRFAT